MTEDSCTFCFKLLCSPTDRNFVDGKAKYGVELADQPFVIHTITPYICKQCITLLKKKKSLKDNLRKLDEQLTSLYQQRCAQRGITFKRKNPKRLSFSSSGKQSQSANANEVFPFPVRPGTIIIDHVHEESQEYHDQISK